VARSRERPGVICLSEYHRSSPEGERRSAGASVEGRDGGPSHIWRNSDRMRCRGGGETYRGLTNVGWEVRGGGGLLRSMGLAVGILKCCGNKHLRRKFLLTWRTQTWAEIPCSLGNECAVMRDQWEIAGEARLGMPLDGQKGLRYRDR